MINPIIQLNDEALTKLNELNINSKDMSLLITDNVKDLLEVGEYKYTDFGTHEALYNSMILEMSEYDSYDTEYDDGVCVSVVDNYIDIHKYIEDDITIDERIDKLEEKGLEGAELLSTYMIAMQERTTNKLNSLITEAVDSVMKELENSGYEIYD